MAYVDLNTLHNPSTGTSPPATWGDQVRDNDEYLLNRGPYICTAATRPGSPFEGQHIYETDTNRAWVYSGAAWILLPTLNPPHCFAYLAVSAAIGTGAATVCTYDAELVDTDTMHDNVTAPGRIVLPYIGRWLVMGSLRLAASSSGTIRGSWLRLNGGADRFDWGDAAPHASIEFTRSASHIFTTTVATDYVEQVVFHDNGSNLTLRGSTTIGTAYPTHLEAIYLGPVY